jgi:hypothetical protein
VFTVEELVEMLENLVSGYDEQALALPLRQDILEAISKLRDRIDELGGYSDDI